MVTRNEPSPFEDHFSKQSQLYAQYRPKYPAEIYSYLASLAPGRSLAWDCGTGNGQAAIGLADYFERCMPQMPAGANLRVLILMKTLNIMWSLQSTLRWRMAAWT